MKTLITILQGLVMGIVETVPGISGSTLALIMGIYEDFLDLLHDISNCAKALIEILSLNKKPSFLLKSIKKINFAFGIKLGTGMMIGILIFSHFLTFSIENYPMLTYAFFFGLILFSINIPYKRIKSRDNISISIVLLTTICFYLFFGIESQQSTNPSKILLFVSGVLGISGLVLPGVSGSFILLILGVYEYVFTIIKKITSLEASSSEIINLSILIFGIVAGFIGFVRILKYLLKNYNDYLMAFLTGVMIASLRILWPFMDITSSTEIEHMKKILPWELSIETASIITIMIFISGGIIVYLKRFNKEEIKV